MPDVIMNNRIGSIRFDDNTILEVGQPGGGGAGVGGPEGLYAKNLVTGERTDFETLSTLPVTVIVKIDAEVGTNYTAVFYDYMDDTIILPPRNTATTINAYYEKQDNTIRILAGCIQSQGLIPMEDVNLIVNNGTLLSDFTFDNYITIRPSNIEDAVIIVFPTEI